MKLAPIPPTSLNAEFKELCERLTTVAHRAGVTITPYLGPELPVFKNLTQAQKEKVLDHFSVYVECAEAVATPSGFVDSSLFLAKMVKRLGYKAHSDIFEKITSDAVIEIYTQDNVQVFRNFRFFEICSYSLEEVMAKQWWQLWHRDDEINREIFLWASRVFGGEITETCSPSVPQHKLVEKDSPEKFVMAISLDYLSPLLHNGKVSAAVAIERVQVTGSLREDKKTTVVTE